MSVVNSNIVKSAVFWFLLTKIRTQKICPKHPCDKVQITTDGTYPENLNWWYISREFELMVHIHRIWTDGTYPEHLNSVIHTKCWNKICFSLFSRTFCRVSFSQFTASCYSRCIRGFSAIYVLNDYEETIWKHTCSTKISWHWWNVNG